MPAAGCAIALAVCMEAAAGVAFDVRALQEPPVSVSRPIPLDAYADEGIAGLIERALAQRKARAEGLTSFEATFRERIYAGLGGAVLRRERAMFHQERAARLRWAAEGEHVVRWLGVRRGVPIAGLGVEFEDDLRDDDAFELDFDMIDPASEHVTIGSDWALHPLADTAAYHYRYRSGDTLRIRFPGDDRQVTLIEAIVEPREARFDRIAGSLWFDADEGVLTRAAYRPAIEYDFDREEPEDAEDVPGFVKPIRARVDFITIDYGLQELRWWLPNRMAFDAVATMADLASMPVRYEWTFEDYAVDRESSLDPGEDLPEGWTRWVDEEIDADEGRIQANEGEETRIEGIRDDPLTAEADSLPATVRPIVMIVPPLDQLSSSRELPEPLFSATVDAFGSRELDDLKDRLSSLHIPAAVGLSPRLDLAPGLRRLRYNRVEGLSFSARFAVPTGVTSEFAVTPRIGIPEWEPGVEVGWRRQTATGGFGITAYRRLTDLGDWGRPLSFGNSFNSLVVGYDEGLYFRETGFELSASRQGRRTRVEGALFAERHQNAPKQSDASLPNLFGDAVFSDNIVAARGDIAGVSGRLRAFSSVDPGTPILSGSIWGEAATGDFDLYGRSAVTAALQLPVSQWSLALEGGAGRVFGEPPPQRRFHLGGSYTLRAFDPVSTGGESFWFGRFELGRGFRIGDPAYDVGGSPIRVTGFWDAGWTGPVDAFGTEGWRSSVGVGVSLMDGLFRIDIGRAVRGGSLWRLHIYSDGLM
ncbi:hypothetical protein [Candidatus Palauibacter soopunensis]|uniref:hypothetical protein n=1 Tax=Candidatus Palauibacter soopunensis TaxID=3056739 RepID=UPI00238F0042|nr:hypothetical protein [Candidatus Palauibacter soopunensis]MDE2879937.1 hypothetical protein [Candidatus Palauibacter soopunensis]